MADGSGSPLIETLLEDELDPALLVMSQALERGINELLENDAITPLGAERIMGSLGGMAPEARQRLIEEVTYCVDKRTGITPLIQSLVQTPIAAPVATAPAAGPTPPAKRVRTAADLND